MKRRKRQLGGQASLGLLLAALTACTVIGHEKVQGWPALQVHEHFVPSAEMRERCMKYTPFGSIPDACAEFNLAANRCDIWYDADFPPPEPIRRHERLHCEGYDHIGSNGMKGFLAEHLAQQQLAHRTEGK